MRNDLNIIARHVEVERFRYVEPVHTHRGTLWQMSSHITGFVGKGWQERIGDILWGLLPAGSISGAPKARTCEIIRKVEMEKRGYYTGICGLFDGVTFHSGVMIRYIEHHRDGYRYRSGGGITINSMMTNEYDEMIAKIYLPLK
jgi:para-aminobenzoate synthetase component 1